jgi:acetoin utilization deacetylase AcuC-like enzyme
MIRTVVYCSPESVFHHTGPGHPESISRYKNILSALGENGIASIEEVNRFEAKWLFLCHDRQYVELVKRECAALGENEIALLSTGDTKISRGSYRAAVAAVGATLQATDNVMRGMCHNAFVVARPPGHHAERSRGMGFCLFNTVAIAARYLQRKYALRRIAIVDWDGHHGNGTESILASDKSFLYWSTHEEGAYPRTGIKSHDCIYNFPIPVGPQAREQLLHLYQTTLQDELDAFQPEFILVSCGFDAHKDDLLGHLGLQTSDFFTLTEAVRDAAERLCQGRLVSVLEGGYDLEALAQSSVEHVKALQFPV